MTFPLDFFAGPAAYRHIREKGLDQSHVRVVLGASGAAKWLVLYGLDSMLFSRWFARRTAPLYLFGTSIGAWKFAAAAQTNPAAAFDRLKDAYIHQFYGNCASPEKKIAWETERITRHFLPDSQPHSAIDQILSHPFLRIGFSAVRCKGLMACQHMILQGLGVGSAYALNLLSRNSQRLYFQRTLFHHSDYDINALDMEDFPTVRIPLTRENFAQALLASGSIPMMMEGVKDIPLAPPGTYRDGGLLDYHPAFPLTPGTKGLILYPHFYQGITLGWFDKALPRRRAKGSLLDHTLVLAPSAKFVAGLPFGQIPDRRDFIRLRGKDDQRIRAWKKAADMSKILGDAFMDAVETGMIRELVQKVS